MIGISKLEFEEIVKNNSVVVVDFFATWCGPCQMYYPVFSDVAKKSTVKLVKVDTDKESALAHQWNVKSLPTTIIIKNGVEIARQTGYQTESQLTSFIRLNNR